MTDARHLRIGTADRRAVVSLLEQAVVDGRLTQPERAQRAADVETALTYADLDALVADLPVVPPSQALTGPAQPVAPPRPGWDPRTPAVISGGASSERRTGAWEVPPYLRLNGAIGSVRLDFREAFCPSSVVDIEVSGGAGRVVLLVPEGWGVDSDQLSKGWGSVRNRAGRVAEPGQPQLVLHGSAGLGSVSVKVRAARSRRALRAAPQVPGGWVEQHPELPNADDLR